MSQACAYAASYYTGIDAATLGSAALKTALHDLIDDHSVVSYDDAWDALADLDAAPSDSGKVVGVYSTHLHDAVGSQGNSTGWNREHSWPKSYGIDYSGPDYSDLMALYAADWNGACDGRRNRNIPTRVSSPLLSFGRCIGSQQRTQ